MKQAAHLLFIGVCVAALAIPGLLTLEEKKLGDPLIGVATDAKLPPITARGFWAETTQKGLSEWYTQHWSVRPYAVRLDNSLSYWAFSETRPEKTVKIGKDRVLWLNEMLWFVNRNDTPKVREAAQRFKRAQDLALRHHRALVLVLLPAKSRFYPEKLPEEWVAPLGPPHGRPNEVRVSAPFAEELVRIGAKFVDGRKELWDELGIEHRDVVYPVTGRHLSAAAMCRMMSSAMAIARPMLPSFDLPPLDCRYEMRTDVDLGEEDYDLFRLLNIWSPRPPHAIPVMPKLPGRPPGERLPETLFVGSSFFWRLMKEADRNHALGYSHAYYYNKTVYPWQDVGKVPPWPVAPDTASWREFTLKKKLIVVDMPEEYLTEHNAEFLEQLIKLYSETPVEDAEADVPPEND